MNIIQLSQFHCLLCHPTSLTALSPHRGLIVTPMWCSFSGLSVSKHNFIKYGQKRYNSMHSESWHYMEVSVQFYTTDAPPAMTTVTTVPIGQNGWIPDSTCGEESNILPLPGTELKFLGHPTCSLNPYTGWATSAPYSRTVHFIFIGTTLSHNMGLSFTHSYRWQYFAFLPQKLNHISHLLHITWSGALGYKLGRLCLCCTGNCHIYVSCLPRCVFL
jgi:hypothetical protein